MGKKNINKKNKRLKKKEIRKKIIELFQEKKAETLKLKYIFSCLRLKTHPSKMLCIDILKEAIDDDFLISPSSNHYKLNKHGIEIIGTFERKANGKNLFLPEDGSKPIFIAERNSAHAMNNDKVKISYYANKKDEHQEGEVIKIIERANDTFVGTLDITNSYAFLITESRTLANDIFIPKNKLKKGKNGEKAIVRIIEWPERAKNPIGEVIDILGKSGENNTEMHAILAEYGLPYTYPNKIIEAAEKIPAEITKEEIKKRKDYRKVTTFTIDPSDAKDFDDALSIKYNEDDTYEIGVHIADVSHYVKENSIIDKEAIKRATSVYLVDRTIPMLPERLCNNICSLRPKEDKLAYSIIFTINNKTEVLKYDICHTVIESNKRFTYDQAQEIIEKKSGEYSKELLTLNNIAKELRQKRLNNGSINFDRVEVKFETDDKGKPTKVLFKESKDANKLVEEFMLLANKKVAERIGKVSKGKKPKVIPYRIHDVPDSEKLDQLSKFITKFGYKIRTTGNNVDISKSINLLLDKVKDKKEKNLIETISIRSMQKATYSVQNIGHYGLAFDFYTHFTSPIRRYPDIIVHRMLTRYLEEQKRSVSAEKYEDICKHCSEMEQLASNAERSSIKYKQVEFMQDYIGKEFEGVISGVTEWGLYVEINENKCEGMIPCRELDDDFYEFDDKNYCLRGKKSNKIYSLGDQIRIVVNKCNLEKKQLDFKLAH